MTLLFVSARKRCEFDNETDASLVSNILQFGDITERNGEARERANACLGWIVETKERHN